MSKLLEKLLAKLESMDENPEFKQLSEEMMKDLRGGYGNLTCSSNGECHNNGQCLGNGGCSGNTVCNNIC